MRADDRPAPRLAFRLARRELVRRPWRTALVVAMVLVPSAAMAVSVTMVRTSGWSADDEREAIYGQAEAVATGQDPPTPPIIDALEQSLPAGASVVVEQTDADRIRQGDDRTYLTVSDLPIDDPIAAGRFVSLDGAPADAADEVVLTDRLRDELDVSIGDTVRLDRLGRHVQVVGVVEDAGGRDDIAYLGAPLPATPEHELEQFDRQSTTLLADVPGWTLEPSEGSVAVGASVQGWQLSTATVGPGASSGIAVFWTYVLGGVALVVLGTIITAAFAISARRQLHTLGLLSASGASPRVLRRLLVAQGLLTGALGAVLGVAVGVIAMHALPDDLVSRLLSRHVDGVDTNPLDLVPIVVLGALVAGVAAAIPARSLTQVSTLQALAGRRPLAAVPHRAPIAGVGLLAAGTACFAMAVAGARDAGSSLWALVAVAGALATLAGMCAVAPWVVARLEGLGTSLPQTARLAGRSLARHRVRSSAVIGAIAAIAAVVAGGSTLYASSEAYDCCGSGLSSLHDDQVVVSAAVPPSAPVELAGTDAETVDEASTGVPDEVLGDVEAIVDPQQTIPIERVELAGGELFTTWTSERDPALSDADYSPGSGPQIGVATPALLDAFDVPTELRERLDAGEAIAVHQPPSDDARVSITVYDGGFEPVEPMAELELGGWFESPAAAESLPTVLVGEELVEELGGTVEPAEQVLLVLDDALTNEQRDEIDLLFDDLRWTGDEALESLFVALPENDEVSEELVRTAILAAAFLVMLGVVAIGLALAAKDDEDERTVLVAVGAPPRSLRRVDALRAALLVAIAVGLALPGGVIPALAIVAAGSTIDPTFALDPVTLAYLVAVPLAVGLCVWLVRWTRDLLRPIRPDTFSFGD